MQDRVIHFIVNNSSISEANLRELMMKTGELAQDIGTIVIGKDAVNEGLIDAVGGLGDAMAKLRDKEKCALFVSSVPTPKIFWTIGCSRVISLILAPFHNC